ALEAQLARLQQPAAALELLGPILPDGLAPAAAVCTLQSVHSDRFVLRVQVRSRGGEERVYALKAYSDDFGERVWTHAVQLAELQAAVPHLDSTDPAPIHGDMAAGQFLWTGHRLVLLDWDMFGYADPAYDVGHFVAQMERRCALDRTLPPEAGRWPSCFRDAYLAAMPRVSPRNVSFYGALTLLQKT